MPAGVLTATLIVLGPLAPVDATVSATTASDGWATVFVDDFDGAAGGLPSSERWLFTTGHNYPGGPPNYGTGEVQFNTDDPANVSLDGHGRLRITPLRNRSDGSVDPRVGWTSARVETRRTDFKAPEGGILRFECRLAIPDVTGAAAEGYWSACWTLGAPIRQDRSLWPMVGEPDGMESINGLDKVWQTLHCGTWGGACGEPVGISNGGVACPGGCIGRMHTYAIEWDRTSADEEWRFSIDGAVTKTVTEAELRQRDAAAGVTPGSTWAAMTGHAGFHLIMNVAIGGAFPDAFGGGPTAATQAGHPMLVDHVAVRVKHGRDLHSPGPRPEPTTSPTPNPEPTDSPSPSPSPSQTASPRPTQGPPSAYPMREAEDSWTARGVEVSEMAGASSGQAITGVADGDWIAFEAVDFGDVEPGADQFYGRVASGAHGGRGGAVEVRLDRPDGPVLGSFAIAYTGGWDSWRRVPANMRPTTGIHDVYVTFTSGQPHDYVNVDFVEFGRPPALARRG